MERIVELGCVACRMAAKRHVRVWPPAEVHHLLDGVSRRGHAYTIGLCPWHHRGIVPEGVTTVDYTENFGPSLAYGSRHFHRHYGTDDELLAYQEELLRMGEKP